MSIFYYYDNLNNHESEGLFRVISNDKIEYANAKLLFHANFNVYPVFKMEELWLAIVFQKMMIMSFRLGM